MHLTERGNFFCEESRSRRLLFAVAFTPGKEDRAIPTCIYNIALVAEVLLKRETSLLASNAYFRPYRMVASKLYFA